VIEGIEKIGLELQRLCFREAEVLHHRDIPIIDSRAAQDVSAHVAVGEHGNSARDQLCAALDLRDGLADGRAGSADQICGIEEEEAGLRAFA